MFSTGDLIYFYGVSILLIGLIIPLIFMTYKGLKMQIKRLPVPKDIV
ncbi:MAG: hypothetical protein ACFE8N_16015 [Promethearchaeota archaeon]